MSNIRWSGIEKYKYNLDANWYVSAQYGNDYDVDGVGLFHPVNNPNGHGGKLRPFASLDKLVQSYIQGVVVFDSGRYSTVSGLYYPITAVGDGEVYFVNSNIYRITALKLNIVGCNVLGQNGFHHFNDCKIINLYSISSTNCEFKNSIVVNSAFLGTFGGENNTIAGCSGMFLNGTSSYYPNTSNNIFLKCESVNFVFGSDNTINDYNIFIGKALYNGSLCSLETLKNYNLFLKSFSEVDLFGNVSESGATTEQIQQIFNGYFYPIMPDDLPFLDMSLKPTASNKVKYGGLNGYFIGALPVGYSFSAADLWNTWRDLANTTGMKYDEGICLDTNQTSGTYRSVKISLPKPVIVDAVNFFNNLLYNESNVAAQRIDVTPDATPNNALNQRTVYDYRLSYSPTAGGVLSEFKNFELNKPPYIDSNGNSALSDAYADGDRNLITIQDFIIEFKITVV